MPTNSPNTEPHTPFGRTNYMIILSSCLAIAIGFVLMAGDGSTETDFREDIFSVRRIVVAPMVCLAGYLAIIVGILWKSSSR